MEAFNVAALALVLHEVDTVINVAMLGEFTNFHDALAPEATPLQEQVAKALKLSEAYFRQFPVGRCLTDVLQLKFEIDKPGLTVAVVRTLFHRLKIDILTALKDITFVQISATESEHFRYPLKRWGVAAEKFRTDAMEAASRCLALEEWDACVYHSMCVLEDGLRWLGSQFELTLSKPLKLENWNTIIENIESAIERTRKAPGAMKTLQGDADLSFYSRAAKEFQYFRVGWRNHVMHSREQANDIGTASSTLVHVAAFMCVLAERA